MADDRQLLPRVICDQCLKDTSVERYGSEARGAILGDWVLLGCHGIEQLIRVGNLAARKTVVWSEIAPLFESTNALGSHETNAIIQMIATIDSVVLFHRVRRSHGAAPTVIPTEDLDRVTDALLLFRKD